MARTDVGTTVQRIRRQLSAGLRHEINFLSAGIDASTTTVPVTIEPPAGINVGAIIFIDFEAMMVTAVDRPGKSLTVARAIYDSVAATHAINAEVIVNPRFSPLDIVDAMQAEVSSYGPQLFWVDDVEYAIAETADTVELDSVGWSDIFGILDVRRQWTDVEDVTAWPRINHRFQRGGPTATTGNSILRFTESVAAGTIYIQAARPYVVSTFTAATDLVADVHLPESMLDVVEMGTKLRVMVDNENGRTSRVVQDEPRRAEETPLGAAVQPFQFNNALYRNRKQEEVNKLRAMWPVRFK